MKSINYSKEDYIICTTERKELGILKLSENGKLIIIKKFILESSITCMKELNNINNNILVNGDGNGNLIFIHITTGMIIRKIKSNKYDIRSIYIFNSVELILSFGLDRKLCVWRVDQDKL